MKIRKIISTILIAAMLFFAPSMIPVRAAGILCGVSVTSELLPLDTAFAAPPAIIIPCPPVAMHAPAWLWIAFACPASIILSGAVANFKDHRQLTYWEAWTCGLLYWFGKPPMQPHH
jgi:hypothetical protein